MRILADTHILLWAIEELRPMPEAVKRAVFAPGADLHASVISVWEMKLKHEAGKLPLKNAPETIAHAFVRGAEQRLLPLTLLHVTARVPDPPTTKDPFDRLLLAQCEAEGMRLLTVDKDLRGHRLALPL